MSLKLIARRNPSEKSNLRVVLKFGFFHSTLQVELSFNDFAHIRSLFLGHNDEVLKQ